MDPASLPPRIIEPSAPPTSSVKVTDELMDFRKRLSDEYKILQEKIDKIGAFRFTIKGWAIAIVGAVSAAAGAVNGLKIAVCISIILAMLVIFLFELEVEQIRLSRLFGERARTLEKLLSMPDPRRGSARLPSVPHTAHEIAKASYQRKLAKRKRSRIAHWRYSIQYLWKIGRSAHRGFYSVLLILTSIPILRRDQEIGLGVSAVVRAVDAIFQGAIGLLRGSNYQ